MIRVPSFSAGLSLERVGLILRAAGAGTALAPWCVALAVIVLASAAVGSVPLRNTDDLRYVGLAASFASGHGMVLPGHLTPTAWPSTPGWPLLLSWLFILGLPVARVSFVASVIGVACMGVAVGLWTAVFARRLGSFWGAVAALIPALSYPALANGSSPLSEGPAMLGVALLGAWLDRPRVSSRGSRPSGALILGLILAAAFLLRAHLVVLWPLALWESRRILSPRGVAAAAAVATALVVLVSAATSPGLPGAGYLALTALAWRGGLSSVAAGFVQENVLRVGWQSLTGLLLSPVPFSSRLVAAVGGGTLTAVGALLALALGTIAWSQRRGGLPPLAGAPVALALPFLIGYPFPLDSRFLLPASPLLGYLAVAAVRPHLGGAVRWAGSLVVWLLVGAAWWLRLAPRLPAAGRQQLAQAQAVVRSLGRHLSDGSICSNMPELLWLADSRFRGCRVAYVSDELVTEPRRVAAIQARVSRTNPSCVVGAGRGVAAASVETAVPILGYHLTSRSPSLRMWCR